MSYNSFKPRDCQLPTEFRLVMARCGVVPLSKLVYVFAVVCPIFCQAMPVSAGQVRGELTHGSVVFGEPLREIDVDFGQARRVSDLGNVGVKSGTEGSTGDQKPMSGERNKDSSGESYKCDGYCGLYFSIPLWLIALWAGIWPTMKPDAELSGPRAPAADENEGGSCGSA